MSPTTQPNVLKTREYYEEIKEYLRDTHTKYRKTTEETICRLTRRLENKHENEESIKKLAEGLKRAEQRDRRVSKLQSQMEKIEKRSDEELVRMRRANKKLTEQLNHERGHFIKKKNDGAKAVKELTAELERTMEEKEKLRQEIEQVGKNTAKNERACAQELEELRTHLVAVEGRLQSEQEHSARLSRDNDAIKRDGKARTDILAQRVNDANERHREDLDEITALQDRLHDKEVSRDAEQRQLAQDINNSVSGTLRYFAETHADMLGFFQQIMHQDAFTGTLGLFGKHPVIRWFKDDDGKCYWLVSGVRITHTDLERQLGIFEKSLEMREHLKNDKILVGMGWQSPDVGTFDLAKLKDNISEFGPRDGDLHEKIVTDKSI